LNDAAEKVLEIYQLALKLSDLFNKKIYISFDSTYFATIEYIKLNLRIVNFSFPTEKLH
jgi:hypothetical protein